MSELKRKLKNYFEMFRDCVNLSDYNDETDAVIDRMVNLILNDTEQNDVKREKYFNERGLVNFASDAIKTLNVSGWRYEEIIEKIARLKEIEKQYNREQDKFKYLFDAYSKTCDSGYCEFAKECRKVKKSNKDDIAFMKEYNKK